MIDHSDGDDFWLASMFTSGPAGLVLLVIAIILWCVAAGDDSDCAKKSCPIGMTPKLMEHSCLCATEAK